jgi:signal transduction histidine kinase
MSGTASLSRRLSLAAAAFIAIAVVLATVAMGFVLHRFVQGQVDQRLDAHVVFLTSLLRTTPDGTISLAGDANGPPFDRPERGWYWQVVGPKNILHSRTLADDELNAQPKPRPPKRKDDARADRPVPADGPGPDGQRLHFRVLQVPTDIGLAAITVSAPRSAVLGPLREALTTLAISLGVLALALITATFLQVRLGLRPLARLRQALGEVRAGRSDRLSDAQPAEILPLVQDLNSLFAQNAANLERARRHVANLAHSLKTPLATLSIVLADPELATSPDTRRLVDGMEQRIRYHLGRARIAALGGPARVRTPLAVAVADVLAVLQKANADKRLDVVINIPASLNLACEQQDLDEIAGNILENAFKWTARCVRVAAQSGADRFVTLVIEDDGPGLTEEEAASMLLPGQRLDEAVPGFGFGLPITRELIELYGGTIALGRARRGGLQVVIRLPAAGDHPPATSVPITPREVSPSGPQINIANNEPLHG